MTFSLWAPALASTPLPSFIGYPLALCLSAGLNLLGAEIWIRGTRATVDVVDLVAPRKAALLGAQSD